MEKLIKAIEDIRPDIVALSYRLSAGGAEKIFMALKETIRGARMIAKAGVLDILKKGGGK